MFSMFSQKLPLKEFPTTLGEMLDALENQLGRLGTGLGVDGWLVLRLLDAAAERMDELQKQEAASRPAETAQYESVMKRLRNQAGLLLRALGGPAALREARMARSPDRTAWWWYLDDYLDRQRRARLGRALKSTAITLVILAALVFLYERFLAPDPLTAAILRAQQEAHQLLTSAKPEQALATLEKGLEAAPDDSELLLLKGATLVKLGRGAEAEPVFNRAETQINDRQLYLLSRGQAYIAAGLAQKALEDGQAILALNPQSAVGYMLLAQAYQGKEDYNSAIAALDKAAALADQQNNPQLVAQAKVQAGFLMELQGAQSVVPQKTPK